ncbi:MAG: ChaN family lipoprotein [Halobacteriovoraceae bacterium]|nr:ChaN family lipoprotein [Halobacteriovoraceae bacterium]
MDKNLEKDIYNYMKNKAFSLESEVSDEMLSYRKNQEFFSKRDFTVSNFEQLNNAIKSAHILYLGDFHSFDQSGRNFERLLRQIVESKKNLCIGIEFVHSEQQYSIDAYLSGDITELEFLDVIEYCENWQFPWHHYKRFFDIAKKHKIEIVALNSFGSLQERDEFAAIKIAEYYKEFPNTLQIVLFGELHIMPNKLPQKVNSKSIPEINQVIIHQNLDEVYWKLKDTNEVIISFSQNEFSLQTSPPWIKYESMIYWYENIDEDPDFETREIVIHKGLKSFTDSTNENFIFLLKIICQRAQLILPEDDIENYNLYDYHSIEIIKNKIKEIKHNDLKEYYNNLLIRGKSFRVPYSNFYYCSNYSINRIAGLCGNHIYFCLNQHEDNFNDKISAYLYFFYTFLFTYIGSKIINPYKKCDLYLDFLKKLDLDTTSEKQKNNIALVFEILEKRDEKNIIENSGIDAQYYAGKYIGYFLGEVMMENSNDQDNYLSNLLKNKSFNFDFYLQLLDRFLPKSSYKQFKKRVF